MMPNDAAILASDSKQLQRKKTTFKSQSQIIYKTIKMAFFLNQHNTGMFQVQSFLIIHRLLKK